uniref:Tail assembly chaperone n=1 Tax=Micrococcus phage Kurnik TaxID=3092208 RepID=A0AAU6R660_9CAUD
MGAPIPLFNDPLDPIANPGAELASVGLVSEDEDMTRPLPGMDAQLGLVYSEKTEKWFAPRVDGLRRQVISVQDLDDEELQRGQVRDSDGKFRAGPARRIPKEFHDELMRRIIERGVDKLRGSYLAAVDVIINDIVLDETVDIRTRGEYAKYVIERLSGKTPDRVEHAVAMKPWEVTLKKIITEVPTSELEGGGMIMDAIIAEDDE